MVDVLIYETGEGGDFRLINGDLATTDSIANQPYLAHFGGNVEASTTGEEIPGEIRKDWWGNTFFIDEEDAEMNSELERSLNENTNSSAGRSEIERKAIEDLTFLSEISEVETEVFLIDDDKVQINHKIQEIETPFKFLWDGTKDELIVENTI